MTEQSFKDIYDEELAKDAIINDRMEGFREDYLVLHCLLKKYNIKSCFECGTYLGWGTEIIKNALGENSIVFSLDLPDNESHKSKQHPLNNGGYKVGSECKLPYIQLRGDSANFNYSKYPCEAYYCDGEHSQLNVFHETVQMIKQNPKLIIYHDADLLEVCAGITIGFEGNENYDLIRVVDTRILYALNKNLCL